MAIHKDGDSKRLHKKKTAQVLSIPQILSAMTKTLENAQGLVEDAESLLENNRYPRAFTLAHLACEELIKYQALFLVVVELARDRPVDWEFIHRVLTNHQAKIVGTILLDFVLEPPSDGIYQASELSQRVRAIQDINKRKNYSLYASQIGDEYFKPSDLFDDQAAKACISHARELLQGFQMAHSSIAMLTGMSEEGLRRWVATPALQLLLQVIGGRADLSHFLPTNETDIVAFLNDPTHRATLAQLLSLMEQDLQSSNQPHSDNPPDEDASRPETSESEKPV